MVTTWESSLSEGLAWIDPGIGKQDGQVTVAVSAKKEDLLSTRTQAIAVGHTQC